MTRTQWQTAALAAGLLASGGIAHAQSGLNLAIELPESVTWTQITDRVAGQSYSREWVPRGENVDDASWLIAQQKVPVERNADADAFLRTIYDMTEEACKSATHEEIERVRVGDLRASVGRTQCGQRLDGNYGTFTDRMVIVDGGFAYVVTSELRTPPMLVDGILSFGRGEGDSNSARREFVEREQRSRELVRARVRIE
jgi:hypothetical protein